MHVAALLEWLGIRYTGARSETLALCRRKDRALAVLAAAALAPGTARAVRVSLLLFAVGVCLSRISVGAHFPADVLGAALLSLAVVKALRAAFQVTVRR